MELQGDRHWLTQHNNQLCPLPATAPACRNLRSRPRLHPRANAFRLLSAGVHAELGNSWPRWPEDGSREAASEAFLAGFGDDDWFQDDPEMADILDRLPPIGSPRAFAYLVSGPASGGICLFALQRNPLRTSRSIVRRKHGCTCLIPREQHPDSRSQHLRGDGLRCMYAHMPRQPDSVRAVPCAENVSRPAAIRGEDPEKRRLGPRSPSASRCCSRISRSATRLQSGQLECRVLCVGRTRPDSGASAIENQGLH